MTARHCGVDRLLACSSSLYCVPALVYVIVQARRQDVTVRLARQRLGVAWGSAVDYGWASVLLVPLVLAGWLAIVLIPTAVLDTPGVSVARLTSISVGIGIVLRAFGEELFFRGLLGGVSMRRLGFAWGNLLQATTFLVPHLPLLLIGVRTWPILPVQFAAGWLLGWLRNRAGSFVPAATVHAISNLAAGLIVG